jgi:hypothetical protein
VSSAAFRAHSNTQKACILHCNPVSLKIIAQPAPAWYVRGLLTTQDCSQASLNVAQACRAASESKKGRPISCYVLKRHVRVGFQVSRRYTRHTSSCKSTALSRHKRPVLYGMAVCKSDVTSGHLQSLLFEPHTLAIAFSDSFQRYASGAHHCTISERPAC